MPVRNSGDPGHCDWQPDGLGRFFCVNCGSKSSLVFTVMCANERQPELRSVRECRTCVHLGELLRLEPAVCCGGVQKQFKVFSCKCAEIGECQLGKTLKDVPSCRRCASFSPPAESTP